MQQLPIYVGLALTQSVISPKEFLVEAIKNFISIGKLKTSFSSLKKMAKPQKVMIEGQLHQFNSANGKRFKEMTEEDSISNAKYTYLHDTKWRPSQAIDVHHIIVRKRGSKRFFAYLSALLLLANAFYCIFLVKVALI